MGTDTNHYVSSNHEYHFVALLTSHLNITSGLKNHLTGLKAAFSDFTKAVNSYVKEPKKSSGIKHSCGARTLSFELLKLARSQ